MADGQLLNNGAGYRGTQDEQDSSSGFNADAFLVWQMICRISTATLVKVMGVTNAGGLAPVGFVDVLPMVNQLDGAGNAFPHGTIFRCPYLRLQGGANAVILDPLVGDIGVAIFADHDVSSVIANRAPSNPGSRRRFNMADGLYLGGMLNAVPTQYVRMSADGIEIVSPTEVKLVAPSVRIEAPVVEVVATTSVEFTTPTLTHNGVPIT